MIQIRHNLFETNSSSACVFSVVVYRPDTIKIPKVVHINSKGDEPIDRMYHYSDWVEQYDGNRDNFLAFLKSIGIEEIYLDGKKVEPDIDKMVFKGDKDLEIGKMFAEENYYFSEWQSWGDELCEGNGTDYISFPNRYKIQQFVKDPNYIVKILDGDNGKEIAWEDCPISKEVYTEADIKRWESWQKDAERRKQLEIEKEQEWNKYRQEYMAKYGIDPDEFDKITEEADNNVEPVSDADEYFDRLQDEIYKETIKQKKARWDW